MKPSTSFWPMPVRRITNAALPDVAPLLTKRGYPEATLQAKLPELDALQTLNEAQKKEYGEQFNATKAHDQTQATLRADYMEHLQLARMVFRKDDGAKKALALSGERKQSDSGLAAQALQFYNGIITNTDYAAAVAKKGIEGTDLQTGKVGWQNLVALSASQTKETGEAQKATADRDTAYDALAEWMSEFYATAVIALRKTPQLMEKLGLVQK